MGERTIRTFHLGDPLSVTGRRLVSPRLIEGVYDLLGYMTGTPPFTHQLPRFARECRPLLLLQHPFLAAIDDGEVTAENWRAWLADQVARHGELHAVEPMLPGQHEYREPISELAEMVHPDQILVLRQ